MMTRVILFRTFIAVSLSAGVVATGVILWRLAPGLDRADERQASLATVTTPLEALPEKLPPVRLEPPGESDTSWRLSRLPPSHGATDSTGAIEAEAASAAAPRPEAATPLPSVRVIPIAPSPTAATPSPPPAAASQAREPASAVPPPPVARTRSLEPPAINVVTPAPAAADSPATERPAIAAVQAPPPAPAPIEAPRPQAEAPQAAEPPRAEARVANAEVAANASLVDLNSASLEQLNSLKGGGRIGRAIIESRPYGGVEDLMRKKVLTRSTYEKIKGQVTVR
jgi:hypothetical protein